MADLKRHRFGSSSERHEPDEQIAFMEVDGKIVFFMNQRPLPQKVPARRGVCSPPETEEEAGKEGR